MVRVESGVVGAGGVEVAEVAEDDSAEVDSLWVTCAEQPARMRTRAMAAQRTRCRVR